MQILEKESGLGQKIIDDGLSTVAALKACAAEYADDSSLTREGNLWPESLVAIFRYGLSVRVVAYTDDDDLESREAWNTAKHDEGVPGVSAGISTLRRSSLHQKLTIVMKRYRRLSDWQKVKASLVELYGPGEGGHRSVGVRRQRIHLTRIDTESEHTGWRKPNKERQETLKNIFLGGQYGEEGDGLGVSNGVQILEKESGLGQNH